MNTVECIPEDDPHFANAVRVVVGFVRIADPAQLSDLRVSDLTSWEVPLRRGFGYDHADARLRAAPEGHPSLVFYRDGVRRSATAARRPGGRAGAQ